MSRRRRAAASVSTAIADATIAFGVVVGLNQLATQSPVDAILPVALISVGLGGLVTAVAAVLGAGTGADPAEPPGTFAPPTREAAVAALALGLFALAAVGWRWGIAAQATVVGVQGVRMLLEAVLGAWPTRSVAHRPDPFRVGLTTVEGALLLGFALAALADAGVRPFT